MTNTLIIHGYSDCSDSFKGVKALLNDNGFEAQTVFYGDYESREDNLTFNDVVDGFNDQMCKNGFVDSDNNKLCDLNVIVHSTGGLVIRHWIWKYYSADISRCPVKNIVMLAPANFGSPLAVRGKSFLGSLFKGRWKIGDFLEVGKQILNGLELASPYQWSLTHKDLLGKSSYFNVNEIRTSILVGAADYTGLRSWINKPGTDGTVVIAGTALNTVKLCLDFTKSVRQLENGKLYDWICTTSPSEFCFGVFDGIDHGSIVDKAGEKGHEISKFLLQALQVNTDEDFRELRSSLNEKTLQTYNLSNDDNGKKYNKFQQFIIHCLDDQDTDITDYSVEFFIFPKEQTSGNKVDHSDYNDDELSDDILNYSNEINKLFVSEFSTNSQNSSFRRCLINLDDVEKLLEEAKTVLGEIVIAMKIHIEKIDDKIRYEQDEISKIVIYDTSESNEGIPQLIYPNTTTFIEVKIDRSNDYCTIGLERREH